MWRLGSGHVGSPEGRGGGGAGLCRVRGGAGASRDRPSAAQWGSAAENFECGRVSWRATRCRSLGLEGPKLGIHRQDGLAELWDARRAAAAAQVVTKVLFGTYLREEDFRAFSGQHPHVRCTGASPRKRRPQVFQVWSGVLWPLCLFLQGSLCRSEFGVGAVESG